MQRCSPIKTPFRTKLPGFSAKPHSQLNFSKRFHLAAVLRICPLLSEGVLARLDLAPVGWAIPVLSGRPEYKQTIDRLITEAGGNTDPAVWLDEFIAAHG